MRKSDIVYKRKTLKLLTILNDNGDLDNDIKNILKMNSAKQINRYLATSEKIREKYKEYIKTLIMQFM